MGAANRRVRRFRWFVNGVASLAVVVLFALPILTEILGGVMKYGLLAVGSVISAYMGMLQLWDRKAGLGGLVRWYAEKTMERLVIERGLEGKLAAHPVTFLEMEFAMLPPISIAGDGLPLQAPAAGAVPMSDTVFR